MTNKLPVTIYDKLFEPVLARHGLPDQIITDKGKEWCVAAFTALLALSTVASSVFDGNAGTRRSE